MATINNRPPELTAFANEVHTLNEKWWLDLETGEPKKRHITELQVLILSEWVECLEGERKDEWDDHLPHHKKAKVEMADAMIRVLDMAGGHRCTIEDFFDQYDSIPHEQDVFCGHRLVTEMIFHGCVTITSPNNFEDEDQYVSVMIADIERYCIARGYIDLWDIVREKLEYNKVRVDHTIEHRRAAGGKKW
jgi:hypothetical protein